jgi:pimeloyl-ACP methyl ester carboxylesterase
LRLQSVVLEHDRPPGRYWVLYCPPAGASSRAARIQLHLEQLWELGYNVFALDYRGFGNNAGAPSEQKIYADALAAYDELTRTQRVAPSRIILAERSFGSAVAVELATRVNAAGLLLFSGRDSGHTRSESTPEEALPQRPRSAQSYSI